jgi:hypothetical protein
MTLAALIKRGGLRAIANANPAKAANDEREGGARLAGLAALALAESLQDGSGNDATAVQLLDSDDAGLSDFDACTGLSQTDSESLQREAKEARRQKALSVLENSPGIRYALISNTGAEGDDVILTLGIRDLGTCELVIPKAKYDAFKVLRMIEEATKGKT